MKKLLFIFGLLLFFTQTSQAQVASDTLSGHDVLVLRSGKMIRAKVVEIGLDVIKYKRAGYFNGPTYTISRTDVYAINYPDSKSDYLVMPDSLNLFGQKPAAKPQKKKKKFDFTNSPRVSLGFGFFKSFSKGDDVLDNLDRRGLLPGFHLRYTCEKAPGLRLGAELGTASYKFEGDTYDSYDEVIVSGTVEENVFSISAFAQYELGSGRIRPYAIAGLGLNISTVDTQLAVTPLELSSETGYLLSSGTRTTQLGMLVRGGGIYEFNEQLDIYLDLGTGLSLMQAGIVFKVGGTKSSVAE